MLYFENMMHQGLIFLRKHDTIGVIQCRSLFV